MKRKNKGFTLAELLIVVAIIAVLVAIAVPVFGRQLERSRETADLANLRAAFSEATAAYLSGVGSTTITIADNHVEVDNIQISQTTAGWATIGSDSSTLPFDMDNALQNVTAGACKVRFTFKDDGTRPLAELVSGGGSKTSTSTATPAPSSNTEG